MPPVATMPLSVAVARAWPADGGLGGAAACKTGNAERQEASRRPRDAPWRRGSELFAYAAFTRAARGVNASKSVTPPCHASAARRGPASRRVRGSRGSADRRSRELAMATADREIACGVGHRETRPVSSPPACREGPFGWARRIADTREQGGARDERRDERTHRQSSHGSLITPIRHSFL